MKVNVDFVSCISHLLGPRGVTQAFLVICHHLQKIGEGNFYDRGLMLRRRLHST